MPSVESRIKEVEEEIRATPYNKATQHHIGRLKARLARLREELENRNAGGGEGFAVKKSGDATVALVGYPSVGKSTLLNRLTSAESEVGGYDFTTVELIPGMMKYSGAKIQIFDIPGLISGAAKGRGRGREVLAAIRSADLILIMVDVFNLEQLEPLEDELYRAGVRLNSGPPKVKITPRDRGGIGVSSTVELTRLSEGTVKSILGEYRLHNCHVVIREDIDEERFIDALVSNRVYTPSVVVLNKVDLVDGNYLKEAESKIDAECIAISASTGQNVGELRAKVFQALDFIRVYLKPQGGKADLEEPLIVRRDSKIEHIAGKLHRDFKEKFRFARVWGKSASFPGQKVGLEHRVKDGDVVSIVIKK